MQDAPETLRRITDFLDIRLWNLLARVKVRICFGLTFEDVPISKVYISFEYCLRNF